MLRRLQYYGSEVLRRRSAEVDVDSQGDHLEELVAEMRQILLMENGLGLAAPQVGENLRLFILNADELDVGGQSVFINPVVELSGPDVRNEEGCLSIPGIFEMVHRPSKATVTAKDIKGREFTLELTDYSARAVQHENDHLDGILFVDRLSPIRKRLIRKQLSEIRREYGNGSRIL